MIIIDGLLGKPYLVDGIITEKVIGGSSEVILKSNFYWFLHIGINNFYLMTVDVENRHDLAFTISVPVYRRNASDLGRIF